MYATPEEALALFEKQAERRSDGVDPEGCCLGSQRELPLRTTDMKGGQTKRFAAGLSGTNGSLRTGVFSPPRSATGPGSQTQPQSTTVNREFLPPELAGQARPLPPHRSPAPLHLNQYQFPLSR
ncbi:hypothetical protein KSP39_PZI007111 [Platanthera zijinensis]|uniref:Uncharacterized protein n=1 Tax=Platanthera zijinensis TaxID=2320716 RepID=A0AAP0G9N1_9ASPA